MTFETSQSDNYSDPQTITEAVDSGLYTITTAEFDEHTVTLHAETTTGLEFSFVYDHQGVWDTEKQSYVTSHESMDLEFDFEEWVETGINVEVYDTTERYCHSYILDKCINTDEETIVDY